MDMDDVKMILYVYYCSDTGLLSSVNCNTMYDLLLFNIHLSFILI